MDSVIQVWISSGYTTLLFAGILLFLFILPLVHLAYKKHGHFVGWPAVFTLLSILTVSGLIAFTLFPLPSPSGLTCRFSTLPEYWQLVPFSFITDFVVALGELGLLRFIFSGTLLQVIFNVALFLPVGFLLRQQTSWTFARIVTIGLATSLLIEIIQGTAIFGTYACPYRVADIDDVFLNTFGVVVGYYLNQLINTFYSFTSINKNSKSTPSLRRRGSALILDLIAISLTSLSLNLVINVPLFLLNFSDTRATYEFILAPLAVIIVGLIVPLLRRDGATPGQVAVQLRPQATHYSNKMTVFRRFTIRYLPYLLFNELYFLYIVVECIYVYFNPDNKSLANTFSKSSTTIKQL